MDMNEPSKQLTSTMSMSYAGEVYTIELNNSGYIAISIEGKLVFDGPLSRFAERIIGVY